MIKIINLTGAGLVCENAGIADSFMKRFWGLMLKKSFGYKDGLIISSCTMIHSFFMRFPIDVVFLSMDNFVVFTIENFLPWRVSPYVNKAFSVLELPSGRIKASNIKTGDKLLIKDENL